MLRLALTLVFLSSAPVSAQTPDQQTRFSDAIAAMDAQNLTFYTSVDDRFAELLASSEEAPEYRENQRCVLARIEKDGGADMMEEYIAAAETQSQIEITSLITLANRLPKVMMSEIVFAASAECGPMSHALKQMATPEFVKLMDEPEIMQRLIGN